MTTGKQLKVGSLCNIWLEQTEAWHGAIVTQDLGEGNYSAKLVEASDPYEIGQEIHHLHSRTWDESEYGGPEACNIKAAEVYVMRSERPKDLHWMFRGDSISVSHGRKSLPAAVGSMLEAWESEGDRERGAHAELPEAAAALLKDGRYMETMEDGRIVQYWFRFTGQ